MTVDTISDLGQRLRGRVVDRDAPAYDESRALYNGIDKPPRLIGQCLDAADVVACVDYARKTGPEVAIRGGGPNGPGLGSVDDGLTLGGAMGYPSRQHGPTIDNLLEADVVLADGRLVALKHKYDPTNFFHVNQNIPVGSTP